MPAQKILAGRLSRDEMHARMFKATVYEIFRLEGSGQGKPLRLHKHQTDAVKVARTGHNYVLTTGTGSGKSLAYIIPIVDHVLRHGSGPRYPGHCRVPHECPREQPRGRAGKVPVSWLPKRVRAG